MSTLILRLTLKAERWRHAFDLFISRWNWNSSECRQINCRSITHRIL